MLGQSRGFKTDFNRVIYNGNSQFFTGGFSPFPRGRGRRRGCAKPRLTCQVCGKPGHSTLYCYHRFDHKYQRFLAARYNNPV